MNEPIKIQVNEGYVLILKTDMLLRPDLLNAIQNSVVRQLKDGVVVIPSGFSYEILKPNQIKDETIPSGKEWK